MTSSKEIVFSKNDIEETDEISFKTEAFIIKQKELSFCHTLKFANPYMCAT